MTAQRGKGSKNFIAARAAAEVAFDSPDRDDHGRVYSIPLPDFFERRGVFGHQAHAIGNALVVNHDGDVIPDWEREFGLGLLLRNDARVRLVAERVALPRISGQTLTLR